ncbi:MAG: ABC transporter permease [Solirubrobacterales bacterium]
MFASRTAQVILRWFTLGVFAAMFVLFSILQPNVFPTWDNVKTILDLSAPVLILSVGLTVVLTTGEFDLSFTGLVSLVAVLAVKTELSDGVVSALLLALLVGIGGGLVAGLLVAAQRASSFIVTLALGAVWGGLALGISGGGGSTLLGVSDAYKEIAQTQVGGIRVTIIYALVAAVLAAFLLRSTVFGREAQAVGNNAEAARLAGIRLGWVRIGAFVFLGLCAAVAAILLTARSGSYSPGIAGGLLIPPYVAAFFGTSVLAAGRFNVFGTVVGGLFIATLETGLVVAGLLSWVSTAIVGAVLLLILFIAAQARKS